MDQNALVPFAPTAPVNDLFSTISMARDLLMACANGKQAITIEGPVAKNLLETLIAMAERRPPPSSTPAERGMFANTVQSPAAVAERAVAVRDSWFMQDTAAGRDAQ